MIDLKKVLEIVGLVVAMTIGAMLYFVPVSAFGEFKAETTIRILRIERADLRREVRECRQIVQERDLTPKETEECQEAEDDLKDVRDEIEALEGGK